MTTWWRCPQGSMSRAHCRAHTASRTICTAWLRAAFSCIDLQSDQSSNASVWIGLKTQVRQRHSREPFGRAEAAPA